MTEMQSDGNQDTTVKDMQTRLQTRIETQRATHLDLLSSLQSIVPDLVPSLDLSLKLISSFTRRPFAATPELPKPAPKRHHQQSEPETSKTHELQSTPSGKSGSENNPSSQPDWERLESGSQMSVVRAMVAECLLHRVPFSPIDSSTVLRKLENDQNATSSEKTALREVGGDTGGILAVENALRSISEENSAIELEEFVVSGKSCVMVLAIDRTRLLKELPESQQKSDNLPPPRAQTPMQMQTPMWRGMGMMGMPPPRVMGMMTMAKQGRTEEDDIKDVEALLSKKSFKEKQQSKTGEELLDLIHRPTAKETATAAKFKSKGGSQVKYYCKYLTQGDCRLQSGSLIACNKRHFRRLIAMHTDITLGDCSFLDTCRHMKTCKYVHYELDQTPDSAMGPGKQIIQVDVGEPQWINCDIRNFRMDILGQFGIIMADPPWDIHMELPYGTMADDEMRNLNVPALQTDGLIFLWVTGRAMELGRECLELWGYKRVEELIWVKTNQLQRIIRTGRTGHWLNHSKEHCLVGIKGDPKVNRNIDTDVVVAEVRETSRKPDEMYPLLERIMPQSRKLELFARMHNTHTGWFSLGNQLNGVRLVDDGLRARFKAAYPDVEVQPPSPPRASAMEIDSTAPSPFAATESRSPDTVAYPNEERSTTLDTNTAS